ncbi:MAG TPA: lysylphosphatidylglycerol synthase domain-containing protein [Sphingomonadaceae bacterium]|nr:lysylphosphatidylglycerol synthase domain-containing protein [Sphingomonadaceae bacterium]
MRWALLIATIAGLVVAGWVIGSVGLVPIAEAAAGIGIGGFLLLVLYSLLVLGVLGYACFLLAPDLPPSRIALFTWSRTTREGATDVLPFSQFGGLVVGARTLVAGGLPGPLVYAAMIADMTTEMAAQLLFTLFGIAMLAVRLLDGGARAGDAVWPLALAGLAGATVIMAAFALLQRPVIGLAGRLGERLLPGSAMLARAVRGELDAIYRRPVHVCGGFLLNLLAWVASGAGAWIALRLMGVEISLAAVLTIESLVFTLRSVAFLVPGAIGLQEAAYVLLGPLFGLDPETAVALSLIKRARDIAIGLPALLLWQLGESRRLLAGNI